MSFIPHKRNKDVKVFLPEWPMRKNGGARKCLLLCMVLTLIIMFFYYTQFSIHAFDEEFVLNYSRTKLWGEERYLINTSKCRIRNIDPFNEEVKKYYHRENYVPCSNKELLSYVEITDSLTTLHINQSLVTAYSVLKISCCYSSINRIVQKNRSDDGISVSECVPFEGSVEITDNVVLVLCKNSLGSEIYKNVHAVVTPRDLPPRKKQLPQTSNFTGVVLVGIDSISKLNLVRTMPKTYTFLEGHDFLNLRGYTKIDDNTFPNLMAILTGKRWEEVYKHCAPDKNTMNNCDIIWDKFNDLGFITAYVEDMTEIGTFNYNNRLGFGAPPTDFYFRHYMIASERLPSIRRSHTCSGPENTGERIMNLAKDFLTIKHYPKFGLFWMNSFSHDNINLPSSMDEKIVSFLKDIYDRLDNTILVFFSDHGFRFGDIRNTHTGWLEERLPFIYLHFPPTFKQQYSKEYLNFLINTKRLTTPFDLHMTLQDVLLLANQSYKVRPSQACPKCHSLFQEIQESRTCEDAAIDQHWCVCKGHAYINPLTPIVQKAADFMVGKINAIVRSGDGGNLCAHYYLKKVTSSGLSDEYQNEANQSVSFLLIMIETRPPAKFEATIEIGAKGNKPDFRLLGDISRTNRYGDNSKCIKNWLQKYCYCDGLFTSIKSAICHFLNCI
ncbi:uncharacterized protein LOC664132 isoform X2 [Tribolium castaneum]|uniref:DUF229 domain containing protein n=1 Tax=Tribolium castaneum TaxID=7070 RepID=A0A139WMN2_TRICA|nr:PREDICTED: uncharacterized protein LOC664132 isoform X2 [Tribolium castaneum]KYB29144.1 hypothetical protein TcasGA2_TC032097 [Tribolium castaneum]|eukprot:XP_008201443.1 PREDICTED: uncharacterized protein LOC664132 isoform X2 [Tribolium castaneum]